MTKRTTSKGKASPQDAMQQELAQNIRYGQARTATSERRASKPAGAELSRIVAFLAELGGEIEAALEPNTPNPHLNMVLHLLRCHIEGRLVSASSIVASTLMPSVRRPWARDASPN